MGLSRDHYDAVVIGGGFYGCAIAQELRKHDLHIAILEKEPDLMQRASYVNQARIHQGYHYPRSILTALRSRVNFDRFVEEYQICVYSDFNHFYAVGRNSSKVNARQFRLFCDRIGAPLRVAPKEIKSLFSPSLIEEVFMVREYAFDAVKLKQLMASALQQRCVDIEVNCCVKAVSDSASGIKVAFSCPDAVGEVSATRVFNCTYSQINRIMEVANLPLIPLKHEFTEMALVRVPDRLMHMGITVMDGPFFSVMPFPARGLHSLSHVRYTPHHYWQDCVGEPRLDAHEYFRNAKTATYHVHMLKDAQRYIPALRECSYVESLWEIKTVLPQSEADDSRPILFRHSESMPNMISVMGGKIDNIFDIREKLNTVMRANQGI